MEEHVRSLAIAIAIALVIVASPEGLVRAANPPLPPPVAEPAPAINSIPVTAEMIQSAYREQRPLATFLRSNLSAGFTLIPKATVLPPMQWLTVYWPTEATKAPAKYVVFDGGNVWVIDCITGKPVQMVGLTTQDTGGANLSCDHFPAIGDRETRVFFFYRP